MIIKSLTKIIFKCLILLIITILAFTFFFFYVRQVEPNLLMVEKKKIVISNLPKEIEGLKIVQISDLHGKEFTDNKLIKKVNSLQPDILVITGDVLDKFNSDYTYIERIIGPMKAKYGKFFVTGNNEYSAELPMAKMEQAFHKAKAIVLHNQNRRIEYKGKHLWLVGVDDPNTDHDKLGQALQGTDNAPGILLAHSPEIIDQATKKNIALVLVGHTHGGQVRLPGLAQRPGLKNKVNYILEKANNYIDRGINFVRYQFSEQGKIDLPEMQFSLPKPGNMLEFNMKPGYEKYIAGLYKVGNTQMYVNRGIGETRIPFRLFSPPEIAVFELTADGRR